VPAFGRLQAPDARDQNYPMRTLLPIEASVRTFRYWNQSQWYGDQGPTPQCVGYAWAHWLEDGPTTQRGTAPIVAPERIYHGAQDVDEWPGIDYEGTSVRAGAKVLQGLGFIQNYYWGFTLEEVVQCLLDRGPVVVGTNFYVRMLTPDPAGFVQIGGAIVGGHAYVLNGVNTKAAVVRLKNSWGRSWGSGGSALITFDDMARLLSEDGEACIAVEVRQ
jgi:hypothetical protein